MCVHTYVNYTVKETSNMDELCLYIPSVFPPFSGIYNATPCCSFTFVYRVLKEIRYEIRLRILNNRAPGQQRGERVQNEYKTSICWNNFALFSYLKMEKACSISKRKINEIDYFYFQIKTNKMKRM